MDSILETKSTRFHSQSWFWFGSNESWYVKWCFHSCSLYLDMECTRNECLFDTCHCSKTRWAILLK